MDCTHGTPGGARYCGLCRRRVLLDADQHRPRPLYREAPMTYSRMPANFRELVRAATPAPRTEQPTLEDSS